MQQDKPAQGLKVNVIDLDASKRDITFDVCLKTELNVTGLATNFYMLDDHDVFNVLILNHKDAWFKEAMRLNNNDLEAVINAKLNERGLQGITLERIMKGNFLIIHTPDVNTKIEKVLKAKLQALGKGQDTFCCVNGHVNDKKGSIEGTYGTDAVIIKSIANKLYHNILTKISNHTIGQSGPGMGQSTFPPTITVVDLKGNTIQPSPSCCEEMLDCISKLFDYEEYDGKVRVGTANKWVYGSTALAGGATAAGLGLGLYSDALAGKSDPNIDVLTNGLKGDDVDMERWHLVVALTVTAMLIALATATVVLRCKGEIQMTAE